MNDKRTLESNVRQQQFADLNGKLEFLDSEIGQLTKLRSEVSANNIVGDEEISRVSG